MASPSVAGQSDWFAIVTPRAHPAALWSARLDSARLLQQHPPSFHCDNKQRVWQLIQSRKKDGKEGGSVAPQLRVSRYDSRLVVLEASNLLSGSGARLDVVSSVYAYESSSASECHWWTNFADAHLFGFYGSSLFAQDEWQCMEHPALCALRDWMEQRSAGSADPEAVPLTVCRRVPTPALVMNAPREVNIDAVGRGLYGNEFSRARTAAVDAATTLLQPAPTLSNIIAMEALKHRHGAYTEADIIRTLQTAVTAFTGSRAESAAEAAAAGRAHPTVVVHTGNWGCGAFGGNVELMCILQIVAAHLAGVERLAYHVLSAANQSECAAAARRVQQLLAQLKAEADQGKAPTIERVAQIVAAWGYQWGFSNGT